MTITTTPHDDLFTDDHWPLLDAENPRAVPGDFAYLRHDDRRINVIWWCTDCDTEGPKRRRIVHRQWTPFAYVESGMVGRAFFWGKAMVNWTTQLRVMVGAHNHPVLDNPPEWFERWFEADMRVPIGIGSGKAPLSLALTGMKTHYPLRGTLPMQAFDWIVQGAIVSSYQPTWGYFCGDAKQRLIAASLSGTSWGINAQRLWQMQWPRQTVAPRDMGEANDIMAATEPEYRTTELIERMWVRHNYLRQCERNLFDT